MEISGWMEGSVILEMSMLECIGSPDPGRFRDVDFFGKFKSRLTESAVSSQQHSLSSQPSPGQAPVRMSNFNERKMDSPFFSGNFCRLNPVILFQIRNSDYNTELSVRCGEWKENNAVM